MTAVTRTERFRELLDQPGIISQVTVYDGLGARTAQSVGFESLCLGGFALGASLATTEPLLSLGDVTGALTYIGEASSLPVLVDAGAGWGEPMHVMRTVRALEHAGAAAIAVEDQQFPKRAHYHKGIEHTISEAEMCDKIRAMVQARRDPNLVLVARTDTLRTDGYDEAVRRGHAYVEAGAEMLVLFPNDDAEAQRLPKDLPDVPLVHANSWGNRAGRSVYPVQQLEEWGWKVAVDAIAAIAVAGRALREAFANLKETGTAQLDQQEMIGVRKGIEDVIGLEEYYSLEAATVEK